MSLTDPRPLKQSTLVQPVAHSGAGPPSDTPARARPDRAAFDATCVREGVAETHREALWQLHVGNARRLGWTLDALLADHAAWREFERARVGDAAAADAFHLRWTRYVASYCDGRFAREDAREITAKFFERAFRLVPTSFAWQCPFGIYLRAVVVNLGRDAWTAVQARRERETSLADHGEHGNCPRLSVAATAASTDPSPEAAVLALEQRATMLRALAGLPTADREVIVAMLVEGRDGNDLAGELGIDRQAVYQRLHRAKGRLRRIVEGLEGQAGGDPGSGKAQFRGEEP